ncbi:hypothetical protein MMC25_001118 [Agyrium rufum]|nr:hypothetical protein [Agyrium rufum]
MSVRRSARSRVPVKKYTNDDGLESYKDDFPDSLGLPNTELDPDFGGATVGELGAPVSFAGRRNIEIESDSSDVDTPEEDDEDDPPIKSRRGKSNNRDTPRAAPKSKARAEPALRVDRRRIQGQDGLHSRGVYWRNDKKGAKEVVLQALVGTDSEDVVPFLKARDKWNRDSTFPTRQADKQGLSGMDYFPVQSARQREMEATKGWDWYYQRGGREAVAEKQKTSSITFSEAVEYLPSLADDRKYSVLMGPYGVQKMFSLASMESLHLSQTWNFALGTKEVNVLHAEKKKGWILNLGKRVTHVDWAPNRDGLMQYLAVATAPLADYQKSTTSPFQLGDAHPASIQIWAFEASSDGNVKSMCNTSDEPRLVQVICANWGRVKYLKWCHVPRSHNEEVSGGEVPLGLLGTIWGDGNFRALEISVNETSYDTDRYVLYEEAAFTSKPPETVCTCLIWLSSTHVAAGCANGFVVIFDLSQYLTTEPTTFHPPWYHQCHGSYVLAISSTYPTFPYFIATTSIDGYSRMTDIRDPMLDSVYGQRLRLGSHSIAYHVPIQSFLIHDDQDFVKALSIRCFFSAGNVARSGGSITSIATGSVHASVLIGGADGSVVATNPIRKTLYTKDPQVQQTWFLHEWSAGKPQAAETTMGTVNNGLPDSSSDDAPSSKQKAIRGLSRITEGYKVQSFPMTNRDPSLAIKSKTDGQSTRMGHTTVFEPKTAVTCVAWNPNLRFGGWAAAGMASGLLRVEDLALD